MSQPENKGGVSAMWIEEQESNEEEALEQAREALPVLKQPFIFCGHCGFRVDGLHQCPLPAQKDGYPDRTSMGSMLVRKSNC
jgi:hypothetical protein